MPDRILLVPDKFKGSLSADGVIEALEKGIKQRFPKATIHAIVASDGGDGFLNAIARQIPCAEISVATVGPLGRSIHAVYLWDDQRKTAYLELANASGLELLQSEERKVLLTSTEGTGVLIRDAAAKGAKSIYIGLGGSATNDAGIGMAHACGYRFLDRNGHALAPIGSNLSKIMTIDKKETQQNMNNIAIYAVNDVDNPLFGKNGAAYIYGRQKGANEDDIETLDKGLRNIDQVATRQLGKAMASEAGSGAAGGAAYGLKVFLNADFISGTEFMLDLVDADKLLGEAQFDYIITGEGKFDAQTLNGKLIKGVVELGKKHHVPVMAVCGKLMVPKKTWKAMGLHEVLEIQTGSMPDGYSMQHAATLIKEAIFSYFKDGTTPT